MMISSTSALQSPDARTFAVFYFSRAAAPCLEQCTVDPMQKMGYQRENR